MEAFSILDCEIFWNRENKIPKSHMDAIKEELKTMAPKIRDTMKFTSECQEATVTFCLDPKIKGQKYEVSYEFSIISGECDEGTFWEMCVRNKEGLIANIYSENFKISPTMPAEYIVEDGFKK